MWQIQDVAVANVFKLETVFFFYMAGINFNITFDMTYSTENLLCVLTCMGCK